MFVTVTGWRLRSRLQDEFGIPGQPADNDPRLVGPYEVWGRSFYWRYDEGTTSWEVVSPEDKSLNEYASLRGQICALAEGEGAGLPEDELVALLIQACIVTGLNRRADIMDSVEFATLLDATVIGRVLTRHRGRDASRHLWWVDDNKTYHLH
ncbi:hypothetical protein [Sphingomonas radiodurans]|uniref:hypothetical protein n=1 Tax=Sphingomonas radiodurans TaxID=2890321 RepID=UPI001E2DAC8A|nr:hypothetical protein [Sphingomonas radiodurans]WBH15288.1 hypothetical protein LLW23_10560 [Sphingomonas radiodurans]